MSQASQDEPFDILSNLPNGFYQKCDDKKWQERKEALEKLESLLIANPKLDNGDYSELVMKMKQMVTKDSHILVATLACKIIANLAKGLGKKFSSYAVQCLVGIFEKFKEKKASVVSTLRDASDSCFAVTGLESILEETLQALQNKNPAIKLEVSLFVARCFTKTPMKVFTDKKIMAPLFASLKININVSDPSVRDAAAEALGVALKVLGERPLSTFLQDLDAMKLQKVKEFAEKADVQLENTRSKTAKIGSLSAKVEIDANTGSQTNSTYSKNEMNSINENGFEESTSDPFELLEPFDIITNLPKGFYQKCDDKKWQERKEALEKLESLLIANPKLDNGDYSDLVRKMKQMVTKDSHILVSTLACKIMTYLSKGLGKKFSTYAAQCLVGIFEKFKEKKVSVVSTLREASDACFVVASLESIMEETLQALQNKNPAIKQEVSLFVARCFTKTPMKVFTDKKMMAPLFASLITNINVSDSNVRDAAAEALGVALKVLGDKALSTILQDLDAMKLQKVKEFAEKADVQPFKGSTPLKTAKVGSLSANTILVQAPNASSQANNAPSKEEIKRDVKASTFRIVKGKPVVQISNEEISSLIDNTRILPVNNSKSQRFADESKQKILRWNFTSPREEFTCLLKELMSNAGLSKDLIANMFNPDFKFHLKALETLVSEFKTNGHMGALSNLDLILKWFSIRFFDTNPSVLTKSLDYIQMLLEDLEKSSYRLAEVEAYSFVPYLVLKIGDSKDNIRSTVHNIIKTLSRLYSPLKICGYVMEGLRSKNARQRVECLEEMAFMIPNFGLKACFSSSSTGLKEIAKQIADRDTAVRNSALNALVQAYFIEETKFYKLIGQLAPKDQSLLDERIKRAVKPSKPQKQTRNEVKNERIIEDCPTKSAEPTKYPQNEKEILSPKTAIPNSKLNNSYVILSSTDIENEDEMLPSESPGFLKTNRSLPSRTAEDIMSLDLLPTVEDLDDEILDPTNKTTSNFSECKENMSPFLLNFDEIDKLFDTEDISVTDLKLFDTNIDDILNENSISLPKVRARTRSVLSSRPSIKISSKHSLEGLDYTISQTGNPEMQVVIQALMNLDVLIADPKFHETLSEKIDTILSMATLQFRRIHPALGCLPTNVTDDVNQYFVCVLNTLKSIYKTKSLSIHPQRDNTKELLYYLLIMITEPNLSVLPDFKRIVREMNLLVVPIIDTSNPVVIICSLVRLLNETTLYPNGTNIRIKPLILKCLWKLIKQMGLWANENEQLNWDLEPILTEFYLFLTNHPLSTTIGQDEMPMKTIKTVMHSLVMTVGAARMAAQLTKMPKLQSSEGGAYIFKVVDRERQKPPLNVRRKSFVHGTLDSQNTLDNVSIPNVSQESSAHCRVEQVDNQIAAVKPDEIL